jgi:hypothetical protein
MSKPVEEIPVPEGQTTVDDFWSAVDETAEDTALRASRYKMSSSVRWADDPEAGVWRVVATGYADGEAWYWLVGPHGDAGARETQLVAA